MRDGQKIANALGGERNSKGWSFRCPCHDDVKPSASIRGIDGLVTCFAGCERKDVLAKLDELGFPDDEHRTVDKAAGRANVAAAQRRAQELWGKIGQLRGDPNFFIAPYLREERGITLPVFGKAPSGNDARLAPPSSLPTSSSTAC